MTLLHDRMNSPFEHVGNGNGNGNVLFYPRSLILTWGDGISADNIDGALEIKLWNSPIPTSSYL